jgi:hypothetical protein
VSNQLVGVSTLGRAGDGQSLALDLCTGYTAPTMTVHTASGACHCGNIVVELALAAPPGSYRPRVCDCEFCRKHGAAYVSDPKGSVQIGIRETRELVKYRQGSRSADFLLCRSCGVLVAVLYDHRERLYAAINARAVDSSAHWAEEQSVSPMELSAAEKAERWRDVWFADVKILGLDTFD